MDKHPYVSVLPATSLQKQLDTHQFLHVKEKSLLLGSAFLFQQARALLVELEKKKQMFAGSLSTQNQNLQKFTRVNLE